MDENEFWNMIAASRLESRDDPDRQVLLLQRTLERLPTRDILEFHNRLHEQMDKSYRRELWAAAYIINGGCSDDGFDYFRAWLIAQGKKVFQNALKNPESLTEVAESGVELELLLYVAVKAIETQTKTKFPRVTRQPVELTGDEWEEDEKALQAKYPKLFARFWGSNSEEKEADKARVAGAAVTFLKNLAVKAGTGDPKAEALYVEAVFPTTEETPESLTQKAALLTKAADLGHAGAQYLLGTLYLKGRGVTQSFPKGAKRFRQAAEQGHVDACAELGKLYQSGLELDKDYDEAFKWYQKGASDGSTECEFGLGVLYSNGWGVEQNSPEAFKWFHRAAQNGHEVAALNLGTFFLNGKGVEPDVAQAFKWFSQAAEAGSARAQFNLGVLYEKGQGVIQDTHKAIEMYERAAEQDYAGAMLNLGVLYSKGRGVDQDYSKAAEWYRRAVAAGNLSAATNLSALYQNGRGVTQDLAEAVRLNRLSADAGMAIGQSNLGVMYRRGVGVTQDDQEAMRWFQLAATKNYGPALNNIGDVYENGYGVTQDYVEAAKWYRQAAERGVAASHYSLGLFYRDGLGVERNYPEAEKYLKTAVEKGFEKAATVLEGLYTDGHLKRSQAAVPQPAPAVQAVPAQDDAGQKIVSPQAAAQRALCLRSLIRRSEIEAMLATARQSADAAEKLNPEALKTEAKQIIDWLKDEELWLAASEREKFFFNLPAGAWFEKLLKDVSWRAEALGVIGWALGLDDLIPEYDSQVDETSSARSLKILCPTKQFVSDAKWRDEKDILLAREIAENWLWRARTTQIQKEPDKYPPPAGETYEHIILLAAEHWEKEGLFKAVKGDYPVLGKAYAELTELEWLELRSIATERLYGLNWLCKYSANWDLVPTGT